jgi:hypothetical protein
MVNSPSAPNYHVFRLSSQVAMEGFEDRRLLELNPVAHYILTQTDGQRNIAQVAATLVDTFAIAIAREITWKIKLASFPSMFEI